ncbi:hypothetical protein BDZ89DRAFT_1076304 [Hymenopellis radicata]|nr:hypothetical protein BDZ89DRAFT_1076301 [Hymenopellis radicata]KAF9014792.1 hypothetical protein BDZ89DRAFT_1076304 [Hymenopellis radicata]
MYSRDRRLRDGVTTCIPTTTTTSSSPPPPLLSNVFRCMLSECLSLQRYSVDAGSPDTQRKSSGRGGCYLQRKYGL